MPTIPRRVGGKVRGMSIHTLSAIRRLQREAREQALPSVHIRDFDKIDAELQKALLHMAKVAAQAMREGKLGRPLSPLPRYYDVYFDGTKTLAEDEEE